MERELTHADAAELLGAYALDALDADEREAVEQHLEACPRCRAEVADHRTVASFMGSAGGPAPDGLWDRIAGSLEEAPPELRLAPVVPLRERRSVSVRVGAAAAALAAGVIGVLGAEVVHLNHQVDHVAASDRTNTALMSAATHALANPDAQRVSMRSPDGSVTAQVAVLPDGTGFLVADRLPALASDRTYQLWALAGGQKISAGVLGARPQIVAFRYAPAGLSGFAVTAEHAGGVSVSQNTPVVVGTA
ncbi:MAG: anti-sigma factor, partial [Acidimicrobiia bacterium]|nr:anti-sigma factor [Acidimicrobiia bacterium]